jgi:hypothetical protein
MRRAWSQGWDSLGPVPDMRVSMGTVTTQTVTMQVRSGPPWFATPEEAANARYRKPRPMPCANCMRIYLDEMSPACVLLGGEQRGKVWFRCRSCGHSFHRSVV